MAIHPTRKQHNFYSSLKKQVIDASGTGSIPVYFSAITDVPYDYINSTDYTKWVIVEVGDKVGEDISEIFVFVHLFTKEDPEFDDIMELEDTVMQWFLDAEGHLNGFDLYNADLDPWEKIGGIKVYQERVSNVSEFKTGVNFKTITLLCKWAAI